MRCIAGSAWLAASLPAWLACGEPVDQRFERLQTDVRAEPAGTPRLVTFDSCDALLAGIHAELVRHVHERAEVARMPPSLGNSAAALSVVAPAERSEAATGFLPATERVPGVVESGAVQTEGDRIYLIDAEALHVIQAWPLSEAALVASLPIEGAPRGLLVHDGIAVVFSEVFGELGSGEPLTFSPPYFAKLMWVDTTVSPPHVLREVYLEGQLYWAHRTGSIARGLVHHYYGLQLEDPVVIRTDPFGRPLSQAQIDRQVDTWVRITTASIERSTLDDYLPRAFERTAGELVERPLACDEYHLSVEGVNGFGTSVLFGADIAAPSAPLGSLALMGNDGEVFVDTDAAVLRFHRRRLAEPDELTDLHLFAFDGVRARYEASGVLPGYVSSSLYFERRDGVIRVITSEDGHVDLVTLGTADGGMHELGRVRVNAEGGGFSAPSFVEDRAYGLTSTIIGPGELVVVDLTDAYAPRLGGTFATEAYSNVILPLPADQVLVPAQTYAGGEERVTLQLFDVQDASNPMLAAEYRYAEPSSTSGTYDARSVGFHPRGLFTLPLWRTHAESSLELFSLSRDEGFTRLGGVPSQFGASLLRGDIVFAFAGSSVAAYRLDALAGPPLVQLDLDGSAF